MGMRLRRGAPSRPRKPASLTQPPTRCLWNAGVAARELHGREPDVASAIMESPHPHRARRD
jgi:hypothetical protein